jgi:hypothetical protein
LGFSIAFGVLAFEETVKKRALNVLDAWTEGLCTFRKTKKKISRNNMTLSSFL